MSLYNKILQVFASITRSLSQKADFAQMAPLFDPGDDYGYGDLVTYNNQPYVCVRAHSGEWDAGDFVATTIGGALAYRARLLDLAPEFSTSTAYVENQLVVRGGVLQKCTGAGVGGNANFEDATVEDALAAEREVRAAADTSLQSAVATKAELDQIAPEFDSSASASYELGQLVQDNGALKICTSPGAGSGSAAAAFDDGSSSSPITVESALAVARAMTSYTSSEQPVNDNDGELSLMLQDHTFNVVYVQGYGGRTISVSMPTVPGSGGARKVIDVLLRMDTGTTAPDLAFSDGDVYIPTDSNPNWAKMSPLTHNIFTFTYAGQKWHDSSSSVWMVGHVSAAMEEAESS